MTNNKPGSATMNEEKQREQTSKSEQSSGKENNPGNFANDPKLASETGQKSSKNNQGDSVRI